MRAQGPPEIVLHILNAHAGYPSSIFLHAFELYFQFAIFHGFFLSILTWTLGAFCFLFICAKSLSIFLPTINQYKITPVTALFIINKRRKQRKFPSISEWINEIGHIYTIVGYPATQKNKVVMQATTRLDLEKKIFFQIKEARHKRPLIWNVQNRKNCRSRNEISGCPVSLVLGELGKWGW